MCFEFLYSVANVLKLYIYQIYSLIGIKYNMKEKIVNYFMFFMDRLSFLYQKLLSVLKHHVNPQEKKTISSIGNLFSFK